MFGRFHAMYGRFVIFNLSAPPPLSPSGEGGMGSSVTNQKNIHFKQISRHVWEIRDFQSFCPPPNVPLIVTLVTFALSIVTISCAAFLCPAVSTFLPERISPGIRRPHPVASGFHHALRTQCNVQCDQDSLARRRSHHHVVAKPYMCVCSSAANPLRL